MEAISYQGRIAPIAISPLDSTRGGRGLRRHGSSSSLHFASYLYKLAHQQPQMQKQQRPQAEERFSIGNRTPTIEVGNG